MIEVSNPHFIDGFEAQRCGLPEEANPFLYLANPYRLWRYGWRTAAFSAMAERGIHTPPSDDQATGPDEATLLRLDKTPFDQGRVARLRGLALSDCPYGPGSPDYVEWQQGWVETDLCLNPPAAKPVEKLSWFAWLVGKCRDWWNGIGYLGD